jgi:phage FluMu protein Com
MPGKNDEVRCPGCGRRVHWSERQGRDRIVCPRCRVVFEAKPLGDDAPSSRGGSVGGPAP